MSVSNVTNESSYTKLKTEIEQAFGEKINSYGDCMLLSEEVFAKVSIPVSSSTLRRFFGLVKSHHLPSSATLDILSQYCGFTSFDEFKRLKNGAPGTGDEDHYSQSILMYLVSIFKNTPVNDVNDKTFLSIVEKTINFLQRHPALIDKFQRAIAKTKNGQDFYYEQFINIDALNSYYGDGLRYYLNEKNTPEAQIFGHSLLCLKHWFSENPADVKQHHDELIKHHLSNSFHPSLCGRYFATKLIYANSYKLPAEKILTNIHRAHSSITQATDDSIIFPYFEYMIAPVLFMTGHLEESLYYVNYSLKNYPQKHISIPPESYQTMNLMKAMTLAKAGKKKEAEKLYAQVHPSRFHFRLKKTNTIQYLLLGKYLNKNSKKSDLHLQQLIKETGFTKLSEIFE